MLYELMLMVEDLVFVVCDGKASSQGIGGVEMCGPLKDSSQLWKMSQSRL